MESVIFLITALIIVLGYYYKKFQHRNLMISNVPGPHPLPIIGNGMLFLFKSPSEILKVLQDCSKEYGKTFRIFFGPTLQVVLMDPKDVEVILSSPKFNEKSEEYNFLSKWLGDGLLVSKGSKWHTRRKIITPTFHFKILEQFVEVFNKQSTVFAEKLETFDGKDVDVFPLVCLCALDVICETAMGVELDSQKGNNAKYVHAVKEISTIMLLRIFNFLSRSDYIYNLTPTARREKKVLKILHEFSDSVIVSRREKLMQEEKAKDGVQENEFGEKKKLALLDVLLQSQVDGKPLSNNDIREEIDTFMFEGHDTTTSGIAFAMYNLAKYPEVQQKVFDETIKVLGDDLSKPVTISQLNDLHYLDLVIKETLRMFPPVPLFSRKFHEDFELNGKMIPKDTNIVIAPFLMGEKAELFPDPKTFNPLRFDVTTDNIKQNPYGYVPFSAGPRNCIGQKFAILELKSILSKTIRYLELSLPKIPQDPILIAELILRPENGIILNIKKRKY